jgi:predicted N-acetyltransferase YhbS
MRGPVAIRRGERADAGAVRELDTLAFGQPDEAALVERLRGRTSPYLGPLAVDDRAIGGHQAAAISRRSARSIA